MKRINSICNLINNKKIVMDIGSDHAYLAINLLKNKKCEKVINVEIATEPLALTIKNLTKNDLLDKSINILNNGLKNVSRLIDEKNIDVLTISGLGGSSIVEILTNRDKIIEIKEMILVPNNNHHLVREWAINNGYKIIYEQVIYQDDLFYFLIKLDKNDDVKNDYSDVEISFGRINILNNTAEFKNYLSQLKQMILEKKLNYKNEKYRILLEQINKI